MCKKPYVILLLICASCGLAACGKSRYDIELSPLVSAGGEETADPAASAADGGAGPEIADTQSAPRPDTAEPPAGNCFVYICGAVVTPGVYEVPAGSRIFEVLELAGGFGDEAAADAINLAMTVSDGSKIRVPTLAEAAADGDGQIDWVSHGEDGTAAETADGGGKGAASPEAGTALTDMVNINTADAAALMTLPGIGQAKAASIIAYREEHGRFARIEDIMKITGIKDGVFGKIKDRICV